MLRQDRLVRMLAVPGLTALPKRQALGESHCKESAPEAAGGPDRCGFRLGGRVLCRRSSLACHERSCDCRAFQIKTSRGTPRACGRGTDRKPPSEGGACSGRLRRAGGCRSFQVCVHVAPYPGGEDLAACRPVCGRTQRLEKEHSASTCPVPVLAIAIRSDRFSCPDPPHQAVPVLNIARIGRSFQPCPGSMLYQVYSMIPAD